MKKERKHLRRDRGVRMWIKKMRPVLTDEKNHPLVASNGDYFVEPMQRRLGIGTKTRKKLINRCTLTYRYGEHNGKGSLAHLEPLSIAQTLEEAFKLDRGKIYLEDPSWKIPKKDGLTPEKHIVRNWNAYQGTSWLTNFTKAMQKGAQVRPLHDWRIISPQEVLQVLGIGSHLMSLLKKHYLLLPQKGTKFAGSGSDNLVHIKALSQLVALAQERKLDELHVPLAEDKTFKEFVKGYFERTVIPFLLKHRLNPLEAYSLSDASRRIGKAYGPLRHQVERQVIPAEESPLLERRVVRGIDVTQFGLKEPYRDLMKNEDIANLFDITEREVSAFSFPVSSQGGHDWQQAVLPFYQLVHRLIRAEFLKGEQPQEQLGIGAYLTYTKEARRFYRTDSMGDVSCNTAPVFQRIDGMSSEKKDSLYPHLKNKKRKRKSVNK